MIIEYSDKYFDDISNLLLELEEYIVSIDKDNLDRVSEDYKEKYPVNALRFLEENNGKCYLYIKDNEVLGLIMGIVTKYSEEDYLDYKCPKRGEITELIVSNKARGLGIGNKLINKMENYFKSINCEYVKIGVFAYNENAIKFYKKNNYHNRMIDMIKKIGE